MVRRILVEKKEEYAVEAKALTSELSQYLGISGLQQVRVLQRYDLEGVDEATYEQAKSGILAEPPVDRVYEDQGVFGEDEVVFAVEALPGQYDQRADSAGQCLQILTLEQAPVVSTAKIYALKGAITEDELDRIKAYCMNPVEMREAALIKPDSLQQQYRPADPVPVLQGFIGLNQDDLLELHTQMELAMTLPDLELCREYFAGQKRDPSETELRVIDTYWSDHCRHTTFSSVLQEVCWEEDAGVRPIREAWEKYQELRRQLYPDGKRPETLMDLATIAMKKARQEGLLPDWDESEEINAASICLPVERIGVAGSWQEKWLVMFKNETHNHPTEIEPFGGAATCLGGAIRDPLSGRSYVYQSMRLTGSGDPRRSLAKTWPGKLPQRKITKGAAAGFSSYGNQIGLATGQVREIYHEGYVAKRMEIGAVIAAAPKDQVVRCRPQPGDCMILLGGRTGRDGCGGATGSSKEHTLESLTACGAEVQKGNAPTERKIQRLFRNPQASRLIKRCNDFGAGGVCVALGELAGGVRIDLDQVPKKYEGLSGTELAISESQERMAVVVAADKAAEFIRLAAAENLEATQVATVTAEQKLIMTWQGQTIVCLERAFLDTHGVTQKVRAFIRAPQADLLEKSLGKAADKQNWLKKLSDLNVCSQRGLTENFDSTIGSGSILHPYGGKYQLTPAEGMAAKIPVPEGDTKTATVMTWGLDPFLSERSPFHGAMYAIVEAVNKTVAMGANWRNARLSLQEYFEKLGQDPEKWGRPLAALLGAFWAQTELGLAALGGKDSMSGSFLDKSVPPTLAAFAVAPAKAEQVLSPEWKQAGSEVLLLSVELTEARLPDVAALKQLWDAVYVWTEAGNILAARTVGKEGVAAGLCQMAFGNGLGLEINCQEEELDWFSPQVGAILVEIPAQVQLKIPEGVLALSMGTVSDIPVLRLGKLSMALSELLAAWQEPLQSVFPERLSEEGEKPCLPVCKSAAVIAAPMVKGGRPRVLIPVFPGTNCEYDSAKAFVQAGAIVETLVFCNLTPQAVSESLTVMAKAINKAQMIMLPGGFSAGDEPDGSGKFITAVFRSPRIAEAVTQLLESRDGLMLGICNGFQALIKLGLLPYGSIRPFTASSPTLTYNTVGHHVSAMVRTRIVSNLSPWLALNQCGDIHTLPVSHGEGRLVLPATLLQELATKGQIAAQYVDWQGQPSLAEAFCPNGSEGAVEALTSPDGRILGKMAHSERVGTHVGKNIPGCKDQQLFSAGVRYFL